MSASGGLQSGLTGIVEQSPNSGIQANAAINIGIPATPGKVGYVSGFAITGLGAISAGYVTVTLSGPGAPLLFILNVPAGVTAPLPPMIIEFARPIAAAAPNTLMLLNVPALGAGNTACLASLHGFLATVNLD